ncbi:hypothetical protein KJ975_02380 [Myxococcota bacterium]|nr:hypothetical protein [Myxococcota bacterium]
MGSPVLSGTGCLCYARSMSPAPKNLLFPVVIALCISCAPHRPWDRSVPAAARTRWRLGQDIFASVSRDVKSVDMEAPSQDYAVRRAAESALLSITAHVRLPDDPARTRRLIRQLEKAGFRFAASRLTAPKDAGASKEAGETNAEFRLAVREWSDLRGFPLSPDQVKAASSAQLVQLIRTHLYDPSGAVAIWALELARRSPTGARRSPTGARDEDGGGPNLEGLDCAAWQKLTSSAVETHSERVVEALWPMLRAACTIDELEAWAEALDGRIPEVLRLFGEAAGFERRIRVCTTTGALFPAAPLRAALMEKPSPSPVDLALGFLCSGPEFLDFSARDPALEALRLHLSGRTADAIAHLADRRPQDNASSRLNAGRLALFFGDRTAAMGHFRWAAAAADRPDLKIAAYHYQRLMSRFTAEEEWTALAEQWRLDPVATGRELWLAGHWPALVLLSGRVPAPYAAEAARALADYAACRPDGGALAPYWRGLMGDENLRKVWPVFDGEPACRTPKTPHRSGETTTQVPPTTALHGDFHSDLALLLALPQPASTWEIFFRRHAAHPQVTAAAELVLVLFPGSHRHGLAAAAAFLLRSDPGRAWSALRATSESHPDRAGAYHDQAEMFLHAGFRHEAALAMRDWFAWKEAFQTSAERDREDWRLDANLELVGFLWRAGFSGQAEARLTRLLAATAQGDPQRLSRVAGLAARRFPGLVTPESLARTTGNPLLLLRIAGDRPGFGKWRDHVLSQLAILLPDAPEVAWTACLWQKTAAACLDAQAVGVSSPDGIRLPVLLPILDRLGVHDTTGRPDDLRLALHVARWRAGTHADWQFVEDALQNE